jgi:hypothetical protein
MSYGSLSYGSGPIGSLLEFITKITVFDSALGNDVLEFILRKVNVEETGLATEALGLFARLNQVDEALGDDFISALYIIGQLKLASYLCTICYLVSIPVTKVELQSYATTRVEGVSIGCTAISLNSYIHPDEDFYSPVNDR